MTVRECLIEILQDQGLPDEVDIDALVSRLLTCGVTICDRVEALEVQAMALRRALERVRRLTMEALR